jgi:ATP/maltotriose-dependent transcriptional regulator MalT
MLLTNYGRALADLGRYEDAARYVDRAYDEAKRSGNAMALNMALTVEVVVRRNRGDLDGAERALDEVAPKLRATLPPGHYAFALQWSERSLLAAARHDDRTALDLANRAVESMATNSGEPRAAALVLIRRANLEVAMGEAAQAEADAIKALGVERQSLPSGQRSDLLGRTYVALAQAQAASGRHDAAAQSFALARDELRATLGPDDVETKRAERAAAPAKASPL